jgi:hypothetical protein
MKNQAKFLLLLVLFWMRVSLPQGALDSSMQEIHVPVYGKVTLPMPKLFAQLHSVVLQDKTFGPLQLTQVCVKPIKTGNQLTATIGCLGAKLYGECEPGSTCFKLSSLDGAKIKILGLELANVRLLSGESKDSAVLIGDFQLPTSTVQIRITLAADGSVVTDFSTKATDLHDLQRIAQNLADALGHSMQARSN